MMQPPTSVEELLERGRSLAGLTLGALAARSHTAVPEDLRRAKGWVGALFEQCLGATAKSRAVPDFEALGIELKTVPVTPALVPLESTAVCQIDPIAIAGESWETSYVRAKLAHVLFVALEVPPGARSVGDRRVSAVRLWSPAPDEEAALRADFELFVREFFRRGRAAEITGHLGVALQVRPKGRDATDMRAAYDAAGRPTRIGKMGFYLRPTFVRQIFARASEA